MDLQFMQEVIDQCRHKLKIDLKNEALKHRKHNRLQINFYVENDRSMQFQLNTYGSISLSSFTYLFRI
jgi:hypothetical protein